MTDNNNIQAPGREGGAVAPKPEHGKTLKKFRGGGSKVKPKHVFWGLGLILLVGLLWFGVSAFAAVQKITDSTDRDSPFLRLFGEEVSPDALNGEGDGRINILLIGIGGAGHKGGELADTIMVASIDPQNKKLALLSLPRDLRVPIEGYGTNKINAAHSYGEQEEEGKGPRLLKQTVSDVLDLPLHYYVKVDFTGFEEFIDAIGGITVDVPKAISDPYYPDSRLEGYEPFYLDAGAQQLNGQVALKYARSRKTTSDFDRALRQQQILLAVREQATSLGVIANPVKISELLQIVGNHLRTDLSPTDMQRLFTIVQDIDQNGIVMKVLDNSPDGPLKSISDGGYYLVPKTGDFSEVQRIAHELFTDPYLVKEQARIEILNGSGTAGEALQLQEDFEALGYNVVSINKTDQTDITKIEDYSGEMPFTVRFLSDRLGVQPKNMSRPIGAEGVDIRVIIGSDYLER